jgi:hypothetical protein
MIPDPVFPALPLIPNDVWDHMTEQQKWERHLIEVGEATRIFNERMAAGVDPFEAAKGLPVPRMNRPSQAPSLQELLAAHGGYDKITATAWQKHDAAINQWQIDRLAIVGGPISSKEMKERKRRKCGKEYDMSSYSDKVKRLEQRGLYKVKDLEDLGGEATHVISILVEDEVRFEKEMDILYFEDTGRQLSLNLINGKTLIELFGDDPETWKGHSITLFVDEYREGKLGIRLRKPPNGGAVAAAKAFATVSNEGPPALCDEMDDSIPF